MKISNETKVGILATCAIVIVILGVNFMKGKNILSRNVTLYSMYDNVNGISPSNPVMLYGLKVGQVDDVELLKDTTGKKIKVTFHVDGDVKISDKSIARIISSGLLGGMALQLDPRPGQSIIKKGDELPGEVEQSLTEAINQVVAPVRLKVENLITSVDTVVTALNDVFNEDTKKDLRFSFKSIRKSLDQVESTTNNLDEFIKDETSRLRSILANVDHITNNLKKNSGKISAAIENVSAITDSLRALKLKETIDNANAAVGQVASIMSKIEKGEGTVGMLINDKALYEKLKDASDNLDKLILDIKANPDRYVNVNMISIGKKK